MKYEDLDDKAKEKAREWYTRNAFCDSSDWDHVYADAVRIGALMGIEIGMRSVLKVRGGSYEEPDINFSGFWSQGDGACWAGYLRTAQCEGAVERVRKETGANEALGELAGQAEAIHGMIAAHHMMRRLADADFDDDYPEVELGMSIKIEGKSHHGFSTRMRDVEVTDEIEKAVNEFVEEFADWIYNSLESEHDYQTSDEAVVEAITSNNYNFDEDGDIS